MDIQLAGYNVGVELAHDGISHCSVPVTSETLCAAYARISRSSDSIATLRAKAAEDVNSARKSNKKIIFDMGHASIAEHAVFNFDIVDVSRLVVEAIEHSRLASYTEKSQRYVTFDPTKKEYMVPQELINTPYAAPFVAFVQRTHEAYHSIYAAIEKQKRPQEASVEEDARYVTSLATTAQLGMTINGRSLGAMIRRLRSLPLDEAKAVGDALYNEVTGVASSLFCHCEPDPLQQFLLNEIRSVVSLDLKVPSATEIDPVYCISGPAEGFDVDELMIAHLIHQTSNTSMDVCFAVAKRLPKEMRRQLFASIYKHMDPWTAVPRQWELTSLTFEVICSASCFAQLKRHRIATIIPQDYNLSLGYTIPESIRSDASALGSFNKIMEDSSDLYDKLLREFGVLTATYALTQAHRRSVVLRMNLRELYHFSRLREDRHAQGEIRDIAVHISEYVRKIAPLSTALLCGKDRFDEVKSGILRAI